jgi:hypothetical protein
MEIVRIGRLFTNEFAEGDMVGKPNIHFFINVAGCTNFDNPHLVKPLVLESVKGAQLVILGFGTVADKILTILGIQRNCTVENIFEEGSMFFTGLDTNNFGLDGIGETGRDSGFEMTERKLGSSIWQSVAKVCLKMVQMRIVWVHFCQEANTGGLQSVEFVLFEENTVGGCVFSQELSPFNMGKAGRHTENEGH